jgi:hypothetical protein
MGPTSATTAPADRRRTLAVATLGAVVVAAAYGVHATLDLALSNQRYVLLAAAMVAASGLAALALWQRARRRDVAIVLALALAARLLVAFDMPTLSDDAYRFVWDGRVQAAGINPYRHPPAAPELHELRDHDVFTEVNRPFTPTLYPPTNQIAFYAINRVAGEGVVQVKLAWLAVEAAVVALLLAALRRVRRSPGRVALYAWHPLAVVEVAGNGHPEPLLVAFTLAALLLWDGGRRAAAGAALAAAALTRFVPVLLAPFLARRGGARFAVALVSVSLLLYLPYLGAGPAALGSVGQFGEENFGAGPFRWLVTAGLPAPAVRWLLIGLLAAGVAATAARPPPDLTGGCRYAALLFGGAALASSQVQPWYLLWVLPFLCVAPSAALLWACATVSGFYLAFGPASMGSEETISVIVWGPTVALLALQGLRFVRARGMSAGVEAARPPAREPA